MSVERALQWLADAELPTGGISAWREQSGARARAYPEVTGYLIPTMLAYDMTDLAARCADWLVSIQNEDGSWNGIDGLPRTFDTAAIIEGLDAILFYSVAGKDEYATAIDWAQSWLIDQKRVDGSLRRVPDRDDTNIYTMRAGWIMASLEAADYWNPDSSWPAKWGERERPHYIAYGLDGLYRLLKDKTDVRTVLNAATHQPLHNGLMPFWSYQWKRGDGYCTTSTLQFAILYRRFGMEHEHLIDAAEAMQAPDGGFYHGPDDLREISWALKFYLDAKHDRHVI